ncbi:MAG: hypothetical protein AAGH38_09405 [Pseudomonadota bacterium]
MPQTIGIVCGLKSEKHAIEKSLGRCELGDVDVRIGVSGARASQAGIIANDFAAEGAVALMSVGVSGGLDPSLSTGDLVIGADVICVDGGAFKSDAAFVEKLDRYEGQMRTEENTLPAGSPQSSGPTHPLVFGRILGSDTIIQTPEQKAHLFDQLDAIAVDMESHAVASAAERANIPFVAVRAIADTSNTVLPSPALDAVAPDGSTKVLSTLTKAFMKPSSFPALIKLGQESAIANDRLATDIGPVLKLLFK